jgi:hypothetical protein
VNAAAELVEHQTRQTVDFRRAGRQAMWVFGGSESTLVAESGRASDRVVDGSPWFDHRQRDADRAGLLVTDPTPFSVKTDRLLITR